jgi:hypothetical protein
VGVSSEKSNSVDQPANDTTLPATKPYQPVETNNASPFLSDAKVEKRPLGSDDVTRKPNSFEPNTSVLPIEDTPNTPIESQNEADDEPPVQPLQPELSNDLLSIEASDLKEASSATPSVEPAPLDHRLSDHGSTDKSSTMPVQPTTIIQRRWNIRQKRKLAGYGLCG